MNITNEERREMRDKISRAILSVKMSQTIWEDDEDIVTFNGRPIGGTIARRRVQEFYRWWTKEFADLLADVILSAIDAGKEET